MADDAASDKRSRRRADTRERILQAAEATFLEKGFHGSSVDLIASRADHTSGAIYWHFKDKDGLFLAVADARFDRLFVEQSHRFRAATSGEDIAAILAKIAAEQGDLYYKWGAVSLEFYAYGAWNPRVLPRLQATMQRAAQWAEVTFAPLAEKGAVPAPKFAHIMLTLLNGLSIIRMTDPSFNEPELITLILSRVISGDQARIDERP